MGSPLELFLSLLFSSSRRCVEGGAWVTSWFLSPMFFSGSSSILARRWVWCKRSSRQPWELGQEKSQESRPYDWQLRSKTRLTSLHPEKNVSTATCQRTTSRMATGKHNLRDRGKHTHTPTPTLSHCFALSLSVVWISPLVTLQGKEPGIWDYPKYFIKSSTFR